MKNETEIEVLETSTAMNVIAAFNDVESIETFRKQLTEENLSEFSFTENDEVIGEYSGYAFSGVSYSMDEETNRYTATFSLRELSSIEKRVIALEKENSMLTECILEMSEVLYAE